MNLIKKECELDAWRATGHLARLNEKKDRVDQYRAKDWTKKRLDNCLKIIGRKHGPDYGRMVRMNIMGILEKFRDMDARAYNAAKFLRGAF